MAKKDELIQVNEAIKKAYEGLKDYKQELQKIFFDSQEAFEKQLSFISAGALALSVGFIKDIVQPLGEASYKGCLGWGWALLVVTLLINCISHMMAANHANKSIKEINEYNYDDKRVIRRNKRIQNINKFTVGTMILGIAFVVFFITLNTLL